LWVNNTTQITVEDIESSLDVFHFFDWDGQTCVVFSSEGFLLGSFALLSCGLSCCWLGCVFAHILKISELIKIKIKSTQASFSVEAENYWLNA
jgi:hypothetical protein